MYCVIQEIKKKKCDSYGEYKRIETYTSEWTIYDKRYKKYCYRYTGERFERNIKKAYKITIHQSYRENGKVKKKQWSICTMSYYDLVDFSLYDCADMKIRAISEQIGVNIEVIYNLIEFKLIPLVDKITEEYQQTEEYRVREKHKSIIDKYLKDKEEFENKYGNNTYDFYYDVFGVLREEEDLKEFKKQHKKQHEYRSSYYDNYKSNYNYRYSSCGISEESNYTNKEKEYLKKIYKAAAIKLHPDIIKDDGGAMKFLNQLKEEWQIQ